MHGRQVVLLTLLALGACDPYERLRDEAFQAGPVDPALFPPENLGLGGDRARPGFGVFQAAPAWVGGQVVAIYPYPVRRPDPTRLDLALPPVYVFDTCTASPGYSYDPRRDAVRGDEQGAIFAALPEAVYAPGQLPTTSYEPLVQRVPVTSLGHSCQALTTEAGARVSERVRLGMPDGTIQAFLVIDPSAAVVDLEGGPPGGLGLQRWGWYQHYLLAYLDGGAVPVAEVDGAPRLVPQRLYYPRSEVQGFGSGGPGMGLDVLAARRGDAGYSPLCQLVSYDAGEARPPEALPRDEQGVLALVSDERPLQPGTPPFVYCLQVVQP